ncbi:hypothetical protein FIBSPDRAFT_1036790 [Athelia psychrophila]|uniref:ARM repeat-containing protein n=1 Tax=Athelia psychrophila TaxID=1759441 RepID=A0A166VG98_9AGAM|nr:hypothetical protein FIBSPDRAFT_1036790 [Fibularhizoctonia sp. CBS 109695]
MLQGPDIQPGPAVMALAGLLPSFPEDMIHFSKSEIIKTLVQMLQGRDARDVAFAMGHIAKIDAHREAILQSKGVIIILRGMLEGINSDAAAYVIGVLSQDDSVLEDLRNHDVVADLIGLLNSEDSAASSGGALAKLARNPDLRTRIMEVVPGLVSKLRGEHSVYRQETLRDHIISRNAVKPLVEMLDGPHAENAAKALGWLSKSEDAQKQIVELNAISAIIQMLEGSGCSNAARILTHIGSEETDQCVLDSGMIPALVARLQRSDAKSAIIALDWLAEREILRNGIFSCNAVMSLVAMLDGPHAQQVTNTLGWLTDNEAAVAEIFNLNVVPALAKLLENNGCNISALIILVEVCAKEAAARAEFIQLNVIPAVLRLAGKAPSEVLALLLALAEDETCCQVLVLNAVPEIVQMLSLEGFGCSDAANILTLIGSKETDQCVLEFDMIPTLIARLQRNDAKSAIIALGWLAEREILRNCIVSCNAVKSLVAMLDGPHAQQVTNTLGRLTNNEAAVAEIFNLNVVPALVKMLKNNECVAGALIILVEVCAKEAAARAEVIQLNAIPVVLGLVNKAPGDVITLLQALAQDDACHQALIAADAVSKLAEMQKDEDTRDWATYILELFVQNSIPGSPPEESSPDDYEDTEGGSDESEGGQGSTDHSEDEGGGSDDPDEEQYEDALE